MSAVFSSADNELLVRTGPGTAMGSHKLPEWKSRGSPPSGLFLQMGTP